jgi:hypothetical protein
MAQGEKKYFDEKVRNHGATQYYFGNIKLHGLIRHDYDVLV